MPNSLQAAREIIDRLLLPASLLQIAVIGGSLLLGWWIAQLVRPRLTSAVAPGGMQGRLREVSGGAAPFAAALLILAMADGLLHASGVPARFVDVAVQLTALLLLIRTAGSQRQRAISVTDSTIVGMQGSVAKPARAGSYCDVLRNQYSREGKGLANGVAGVLRGWRG